MSRGFRICMEKGGRESKMPGYGQLSQFLIRVSYVPGNVATLGKCHGSHGKDRKDKYNDKYMGKYKDKNDRE